MHVEAAFGEFKDEKAFASGKPFVRDGMASFLSYEGDTESPPGVLRPKNPLSKLVYPHSELPDIIIYICKGTEKLAFKRFPVNELMSDDEEVIEKFQYNPEWHEFLPIAASSAKLEPPSKGTDIPRRTKHLLLTSAPRPAEPLGQSHRTYLRNARRTSDSRARRELLSCLLALPAHRSNSWSHRAGSWLRLESEGGHDA